MNSADYMSATTIDFNHVFTIGASGDFASIPALSPVTMSTLQFDPFATANSLWSLSSGGSDFSFDLTSISILSRTTTSLQISGTGVVRWSGEDTMANWSLGLNGSGSGVSVSFSTEEIPQTQSSGGGNTPGPQAEQVPDGGSTGWLCALAFAGLLPFGIRHRQRYAMQAIPGTRVDEKGIVH